MITTNTIAAIAPSLRALTQRLREEAQAHQEFEAGDHAIIVSFTDLLDQVDLLLAELAMAEEAVSTNERLSSVGKTEEMSRIVADIHKRLSFVQKKSSERRDAFESEKAVIFSVPKPVGDAVVAFLREAEVRSRVRALSMDDRMRLYLDAVQRGQSLVVRAIKDADATLGEVLLDPSFIERVDREAVELGQPERWARLQTLEKCAAWLQTLAGAIDGLMSGYGQPLAFPGRPTRTTTLNQKDQTAPPDKSNAADRVPAGGSSFQ